MKTLVIAAHPDDEVLGCGGTLHKLSNTPFSEVVVLYLTNNIARHSMSMEKLEAQVKLAGETLGIKKQLLIGMKDQGLHQQWTYLKNIIDYHVKKENPDTVFTHCGYDLNDDHRLVFEATLIACRPYRGGLRTLLTYEVPVGCFGMEKKDQPLYSVLSKENLEKKIEAFTHYQHEQREYPDPRSKESVELQAKVTGNEIGTFYAEKFGVVFDTL